MKSKKLLSLLAVALFCSGLQGNAQELLPEELLIDSISGATTNGWTSWRDARSNPPGGGVAGVLLSTNAPFELTRIEILVRLDGAEYLPNTTVEAVVFRGTNQLAHGLLEEPTFECGAVLDGFVTNVVTISPYGGDLWIASFALSPYGWGTNRVLSVRSTPFFDGEFAKLSVVRSSNSASGATAFIGDGLGNLSVQSGLPAMRVWRRMVRPEAPLPYEQFYTDLEFKIRPGYELGSATNLNGPWEWTSVISKIGRVSADTKTAQSAFFKTRPDATP